VPHSFNTLPFVRTLLRRGSLVRIQPRSPPSLGPRSRGPSGFALRISPAGSRFGYGCAPTASPGQARQQNGSSSNPAALTIRINDRAAEIQTASTQFPGLLGPSQRVGDNPVLGPTGSLDLPSHDLTSQFIEFSVQLNASVPTSASALPFPR
jgi:hypothetical protein